MQKKPQISVIIPVYKVEKYLSECLNSVLAQTFQDFEVICINDGSPDNCDAILSLYADRDKRIKVYTQKNQGLSGARNTGLDKATGKYILFLDSDDILPKYALDILFRIAKKTRVPLIASETFGNTEDPSLVYQMKNGLVDFVKDKHIFSSACNKLYEATLLKKRRFTPGIYFEDWPFLTILMGEIQYYATTKIPCYRYREEGASITRSPFTQKKVDSYLTGIKVVYDYYAKRENLRLAQRRMAIALKMMINKVYKEKNFNLYTYISHVLYYYFQKKIVLKSDLPLKTRYRLLKIERISNKSD